MTGRGGGGQGPLPPGPDVRGLRLPEAAAVLRRRGLAVRVSAVDALFGVRVPENFVVLAASRVDERTVRLDVARAGSPRSVLRGTTVAPWS